MIRTIGLTKNGKGPFLIPTNVSDYPNAVTVNGSILGVHTQHNSSNGEKTHQAPFSIVHEIPVPPELFTFNTDLSFHSW